MESQSDKAEREEPLKYSGGISNVGMIVEGDGISVGFGAG